ncbi:MAG: hypothetical protein ACFE8L_09370, partial [Candidatus Hodarchaeota archaeon]
GKIWGYLYYMTLPIFVLTLMSIPLISWQTRSNLENKARKNSIISNTAITGTTFGFIFMFIILIEITFGLDGMGRLLIDSINQWDYWLLITDIFVIVIMFAIISVISNVIFSFYKFRTTNSSMDDLNNPKEVIRN